MHKIIDNINDIRKIDEIEVVANAAAPQVSTYSIAEVDTALEGKADQAATYTKVEVDTALSGKADTATTLSGYGITDAYTKTESDSVTDLLAAKDNPAFTGTVTLETATATASLGGVPMQHITLTENIVLTDGLSEGQQVKYVATNAGYTIDSSVVTWWEGEAPTLGTTDEFEFYKLNGVLRGKHTGSIA
jgi:hypothetical protein